MYRSPRGPPFDPGSPSPASLICVPSSTPAGIGTTRWTVRRSNPRPSHCLQGDPSVSPLPPHVGHVVTLTIDPSRVWRTCRTSPFPLHVRQRTGVLPGAAPDPAQTEHTSIRLSSICFSTPNVQGE